MPLFKKASRNLLYRFTNLNYFIDAIIDKDIIPASAQHSTRINNKTVYGVSFTRDPNLTVPYPTKEPFEQIRITFNGSKLNSQYKIYPYAHPNFNRPEKGYSESEEFIIGGIDNVQSYIQAVDIYLSELYKTHNEAEVKEALEYINKYISPHIKVNIKGTFKPQRDISKPEDIKIKKYYLYLDFNIPGSWRSDVLYFDEKILTRSNFDKVASLEDSFRRPGPGEVLFILNGEPREWPLNLIRNTNRIVYGDLSGLEDTPGRGGVPLAENIRDGLEGYFRQSKKAEVSPEKLAQTTSDLEVLRELLNHPDFYVRYYMTENPYTLPRDIIEALANDPLEFIRMNVVRRPDLPKDLLWKLAKDEDTGVRQSVAEGSKEKDVLIYILENDPSEVVKLSVYRNSYVPRELLRGGFSLGNEKVDKALSKNKSTPPDILREIFKRYGTNNDIAYFLCDNPNTPDDVLEKIIFNPGEDDLEAITERKNLTLDLYQTLLDLDSDEVYRLLLKSMYTPKHILSQIISKANPLVLEYAAQRLSQTDLLQKVFNKGIDILDKERSSRISRFLSENPATPPSILYRLAELHSSNGIHRKYWQDEEIIDNILIHPNTTQEISDLLHESDKKYYRKQVKDKFKDLNIDSKDSIPNKANTDLELLKRLKGYLKNV